MLCSVYCVVCCRSEKEDSRMIPACVGSKLKVPRERTPSLSIRMARTKNCLAHSSTVYTKLSPPSCARAALHSGGGRQGRGASRRCMRSSESERRASTSCLIFALIVVLNYCTLHTAQQRIIVYRVWVLVIVTLVCAKKTNPTCSEEPP